MSDGEGKTVTHSDVVLNMCRGSACDDCITNGGGQRGVKGSHDPLDLLDDDASRLK